MSLPSPSLSLNILVVDDDRRLRELIISLLHTKGMSATGASNTVEADAHLKSQTFDIMILDIMMEGEDGLAFTKRLQESNVPHPPILLLTARDTKDDCITGLRTGADDYLSKPFEPEELVARICALHRIATRYASSSASLTPPSSQNVLKLGDYTFDVEQGRLLQGHGYIFLTSSELMLLTFLAQRQGTALSRAELAQSIGRGISERSVDVQIARLRRKIGDDSRQPRYLQTVRHVGYGLFPDATLSP